MTLSPLRGDNAYTNRVPGVSFAVSFSNLPPVKKYLASQAEHHRERDFKDEFRELLRRHEIEWDEQYVWD